MFTFNTKQFLFVTTLVTSALIASSARADGYVVGISNPKCDVNQYSKNDSKFVKTKRKLGYFSKYKIAGKRLPQKDEITVFMVEGDNSGQMFAVSSKCIRLKEAYEKPKDAAPIASNVERPFAHRLRPGETGLAEIKGSYFTLGFMSWQEQITITINQSDANDRHKIPVLSTAMGLCPGIGFYLSKSARRQFTWDTCAFVGIANLGDKKEDSSLCANAGTGPDKCYIGKNIQVFGAITGPSILFSHSETLAAGFEIPIAIRKGQWPDDPTKDIKSNNKISFYPLYLFTTHWRGENWGFVQKIGLIKTWPGYFWSLQVNRNF